MSSKMLSNFLEKFRYGRNLTQEEFVSGIVSLRQYKRYRSGECDIPYQILNKFSVKLQISITNLLTEFEHEKFIETKVMNELYNAVVDENHDDIDKHLHNIKEEFIIDPENKLYFRHSYQLNQFYNNKISKNDMRFKTQLLISYPEIIKNDIITDIELLILSSLLDFQDLKESELLVKKLTEVMTKQVKVISGTSNKIHSLVLSTLSKHYGILKDYQKVIKLCNLGIEIGKSARSYYLFDYFYYYLSLAYYKIKNESMFKYCLYQCFNVLYLENNYNKIDRFSHWIKSDYDIEYHRFIKYYVDSTLKTP